MRITLITQNEPFFLPEHLDYLLTNTPSYAQVISCVVSPPSTYGRRKSFLYKTKDTLNRFGLKFFMFYSLKYLYYKLFKPKHNVFKILEKYNISAIVLNKSINNFESIKTIESYRPDLLISILGNEIFKKELFTLTKYGCLNLHTALLPKYRGVMPTFWVLKNNEQYTGVSVFFVDEGIDSGPILVQKKTEINNRTQFQLIKHTKHIGMDAILESIDKIYTGNYQLIENDIEDSTYLVVTNCLL